MKEFSGLMF